MRAVSKSHAKSGSSTTLALEYPLFDPAAMSIVKMGVDAVSK